MCGRLFQRLEQRVERAGRQHVNLVNNVDLVARRRWRITHRADDVVADVIDAGLRSAIHLHHVHVSAFGDGAARLADATGRHRRTALPVRPDAIHTLGDDPRGGRFSRAANARHHEGLRDAIRLEGGFQHAHHGVLTDQIGKGRRAVLARKHLIGGLVGHDPSHHKNAPRLNQSGRALHLHRSKSTSGSGAEPQP